MDRITVDSDVCGGEPVIRGMRIGVQTIFGFPAREIQRKTFSKNIPH